MYPSSPVQFKTLNLKLNHWVTVLHKNAAVSLQCIFFAIQWVSQRIVLLLQKCANRSFFFCNTKGKLFMFSFLTFAQQYIYSVLKITCICRQAADIASNIRYIYTCMCLYKYNTRLGRIETKKTFLKISKNGN